MSRRAVAAILVLSSVPSLAEELGRPGEAVMARVERPEGDRYEITVTPPADRGVDRRVMEWLTDIGGVAAEGADIGDGDPVDMSGYRVRVEKGVSAECSGRYEIKPKPVTLGAQRAWILESDTATSISATAFPTKGDVDVRIFVGNRGDVCATSSRKKQNVDHAGCTVRMCELLAGSANFKAEVGNPTTAQATAVAVFELGFVSLP